jgi:hypothetical protein
MAANDDLDDFFKKKDRKGNKHKKQPPLLTKNEELLKQLGKKTNFAFDNLSRDFSYCNISNISI